MTGNRNGLLAAVLLLCSSFSNGQTTSVILEDDGYVYAPLNFGFTLYGQEFTHSVMYDNGVVGLYDPATGIGCTPDTMFCAPLDWNPKSTIDKLDAGTLSNQSFNYMVAPLWSDIAPDSTTQYFIDSGTDYQIYKWNNIAEYYSIYGDTTQQEGGVRYNSFELEFRDTGQILTRYGDINLNTTSVWAGITGKTENDEVQEYVYMEYGTQVTNGVNLQDWEVNSGVLQETDECIGNPLANPQCPGYEQAYTDQQCAADPLYDPSCAGYGQAYTDQQCALDTLYDPSCVGYDDAYTAYMCTSDSLYSESCSGYEQAYTDQQCAADPLYTETCDGYARAYTDFQCAIDSQYDMTCPSYMFSDPIADLEIYTLPDDMGMMDYDEFGTPDDFVDDQYGDSPNTFIEGEFSGQADNTVTEKGFPGVYIDDFTPLDMFDPEFFEAFKIDDSDLLELDAEFTDDIFSDLDIESEPELEAFFKDDPEDIFEIDIIKEDMAEIQEDLLVEDRIVDEREEIRPEPTQKRQKSGSRTGLSVGLATSSALVADLISDSIESGQPGQSSQSPGTAFDDYSMSTDYGSASDATSGGFYSLDGQSFSQMTSSEQDFTDFTDTMTSDTQESQQNDNSFALGSDINVGVSVIPTIEQQSQQGVEQIEIKPPTLAEVLAEKVKKQNAEKQTGIFGKQESVITSIASGTDLTKYYTAPVVLPQSWYGTEQVYIGNRLPDKGKSYYRMFNSNYGTMRQLIRSQY